jgi:hypothetical protein
MRRLFMVVAAATMMFTSCKKYEVSEPLNLETLPKVTLKGTVYADLDETKPELQFAPAGTVVRVSIPYKDYDVKDKSAGYYVKTTTVDSKGEYSIDVPTVSSGVEATISFEDFTANVKIVDPLGETKTVLKHFSCADRKAAGLGKGQGLGDYIKIDAKYAANAKDPNADVIVPTTEVDLSGKLEYVRIDSSAAGGVDQLSGVPAGKKIVVKILLEDQDPASTRKYEVTKTINSGAGTFTVKIPMIERGKATVTLEGEMFEELRVATPSDTKREMWRYELDAAITVYNTTTRDQDQVYAKKMRVYGID